MLELNPFLWPSAELPGAVTHSLIIIIIISSYSLVALSSWGYRMDIVLNRYSVWGRNHSKLR